LDLGRIGGEESAAGPFLGIILDGTGYGSDGTIWGGEIFVGDSRGFERAAHLSGFSLPGGEAAIREPSRILAGLGLEAAGLRPEAELDAIAKIAANPRLSPSCSSCGRLFDAAAALLGFDARVSFEGEAAIWLESLAAEAGGRSMDIEFAAMDGIALLRALREEAPDPRAMDRCELSRLALAFHRSLARNIAGEAARIAAEKNLKEAFLSGGVYQNRLFAKALISDLGQLGLAAHLGVRVSPNDACISIGQAAYAIGGANGILR
jgi:hydrogenase maturation protein HypF